MDDMREIVTVEQMDRLFLALAILAPIVGAAIGAFLGGRRGSLRRDAFKGLLVGLAGPANLLMWNLYNALTDRMGLDTVKNLLVQLSLFVALGVVAGLVASYVIRSKAKGVAGSDYTSPGGNLGDGGGSARVTMGGPGPRRSPGAGRTVDEAQELPRDA